MPKFSCPIKQCKHWNKTKQDCDKEKVDLKPTSTDYTIDLNCPIQDVTKVRKPLKW